MLNSLSDIASWVPWGGVNSRNYVMISNLSRTQWTKNIRSLYPMRYIMLWISLAQATGYMLGK